MLYDLSTDIGRERLQRKLRVALENGALIDFTEKKSLSSPSQKNYLHLILGYFAMEVGVSLDYAKRNYFKATCSPDIFILDEEDKLLGKRVKWLKSTNECTTEEMVLAIERFRNWSSETAGVYLPEPNEEGFLNEIRIEMSKNVYL